MSRQLVKKLFVALVCSFSFVSAQGITEQTGSESLMQFGTMDFNVQYMCPGYPRCD